MPATDVNPALRRRLSDDARQLLRSALGHSNGHSSDDFHHLTLAQRLQNFRGKIRLELPTIDNAIRLRITATESSYILRYQMDSIEAEVSVLNKAGATTSWITTVDGQSTQLRTYLGALTSSDEEFKQVSTVIDLVEAMDLFDLFRAGLSATEVPSSPSRIAQSSPVLYSSTTDKNHYIFVIDRVTGKPLAVTQRLQSNTSIGTLHLVIEDYSRYEGGINVPYGIKSDVEIMIDTAMSCYTQWTIDGQRRIMDIFDIIDKDGDGFISGQDVQDQLLNVGQSEKQSFNIVTEMSRLLCDTSDPSEEFGFYKFCGFWVTMLADQYRVSDPANELTVLASFERLFLGINL